MNCPFDEAFAPLLEAMLFCIVRLGFNPRIASEREDSGELRIAKIVELIRACRLSIHDLSRAQAARSGETYRLNMPFELGIDYGARQFAPGMADKRFLILEEQRHRHHKTLSDLAGCDLKIHGGKYELIIRQVRNWLVGGAKLNGAPGADRIKGEFEDFRGWQWDRLKAQGFSDDDIKDYPTSELLEAMKAWVQLGRPLDPDVASPSD